MHKCLQKQTALTSGPILLKPKRNVKRFILTGSFERSKIKIKSRHVYLDKIKI